MLRENFVNASTFDSFNLWAKHFEICSVHKMLFLWSKLNGWLSWNVPDFRFTIEWNQTLVRDVIMIKASNRKLIFDKSHVGLPIRMCTCQHAMNTNYDHFNLTIPDIWWFPLLLLRFRLLFNFFSSAWFGLGELNWTCTFWNENTHRPSTHTSKWKPQAGIKHTHNIRVHFAFRISHFHVKHSHVCYVIGSASQQQRGRERLHSDYSLQFYWVAEMWQSMTSTYDMEKPKTAQFSLSWLSLPNNEPKVIRFIFFTLSLFRLHRSPNAEVLQWKMYKQQQFI